MGRWLPVLALAGCYFGHRDPSAGPVDATSGDSIVCELPLPSSDEAPFELDRIASAAGVYLQAHGEYPAGPSSINPGVAGGACSVIGGKFMPIDWSNLSGWKDLGFSIGIPNRYSYWYKRTSPSTAFVQAIGDLDCDQNLATYQLNLDATQAPQIIEPPPNIR